MYEAPRMRESEDAACIDVRGVWSASADTCYVRRLDPQQARPRQLAAGRSYARTGSATGGNASAPSVVRTS